MSIISPALRLVGRYAFFLLAPFFVIGCSGNPSPASAKSFQQPLSNRVEPHQETDHTGEHVHPDIDPKQASADLRVVLVPSELVVGLNRFAVGLFDTDGKMVADAFVHFHYYNLSNPSAPVLEMESNPTRIQSPDGLTTIFTQDRGFARAGDWGLEVQVIWPDGTAALSRIEFQVLADAPSLTPGEEAVPVETATRASVDNDLSQLASAISPNPAFYTLSLPEALANDKPTVLLFATPGFCQTRFCGPVYEITSELQKNYGDTINFVHVEVYSGLPNPAANDWAFAPAVTAFGLTTEPWLYLIDSQRRIVHRVEGLFAADEIEPYLADLP